MKHENYSIGYDLLKVHAWTLNKLIHRSITVAGLQNIPKNTAIIFTPNHQNALMDAMAVLLASPCQPTWLARADIFGNSVINTILKFLKMSPVYRIRDGKDNLGKNDAVFDLSVRVLKNKKSLALFPEGLHTFKRQSAAHKKAVPRIAFMAAERENFEEEILIIPVGLFYSHYWDFNRELIVQFGSPISIKDYKNQYLENSSAAMISLRKEIHSRLIPLTLNIASKTNYDQYESLVEILMNQNHPGHGGLKKLAAQQDFVKKIEEFETSNPEEAKVLFDKTKTYSHLLNRKKISDKILMKNPGWGNALGNGSLALIMLPIFLYGWLNFLISFHLPSYFIRKFIRDKVFWATVEYVAWLVLVPLFSIIQSLLVWKISGSPALGLAYFLTLPIFGKLALYLNTFNKQTIQRLIIARAGKSINKLKSLRKEILQLLNF